MRWDRQLTGYAHALRAVLRKHRDGAEVVSASLASQLGTSNLQSQIAEIAAALDGRWAYEIIYVNDGSTDATGDELKALQAQYPWLRQVRHAQSCGQSSAVRTGTLAARGSIIVTLDGDGQNDPAFLPKLVDALKQGAPRVGLIAGQRVGRKDTGFKRFQSRVANAVRGAILRDGTRDTGCGLKAFPRDVGLNLPYFDGLHRFLPALMRRAVAAAAARGRELAG